MGFWSFFGGMLLFPRIMFHSLSILTGALGREGFRGELSLQKHHTLSPTGRLMLPVYSLKLSALQ